MAPAETNEQLIRRLASQPNEVSVAIATRAALRVFPLLTHSDHHNTVQENLTLLTARCMLNASVAAKIPTHEIRAAAAAASASAEIAIKNTAYAAGAALFAAESAAHAAYAATYTISDAAAFAAADADRAAAYLSIEAATETATTADSELSIQEIFSASLWHAPKEPHWLFPLLVPLSNILDSGPKWTFWQNWYQGFLIGKPLDWELQRRVALIDNAIWEAGPEAVAAEITKIEAKILAEKTPQAERLEFNRETAKFFAAPIEIAKPDLLGAILSQVEDTLENAVANSSNGLHDRSREVLVLRRTAQKYGNDPQRIEMDFTSVHAGITRQFASDELPTSEENLALHHALQEGAQGIRATHPEVAENREILNKQAIAELTDAQKAVLEEAQPILEDISEGSLQEQWGEDIPFLLDPDMRIGPISWAR